MKLAGGGPAAAAEAERMVSEKVQAVVDVQAQLIGAALSGEGHLAPARTVAHYRRRVQANARRLSK